MRPNTALTAGVAGAVTLNLLHETARKLLPDAPHIDLVAMKALGKITQRAIGRPVDLAGLRKATMTGDLISNSLYYALAASSWPRVWFLGLIAGPVVWVAAPLAGLGQQPTRRPALTAALTTAWYLAGALVAGGVYSLMSRDKEESAPESTGTDDRRAA